LKLLLIVFLLFSTSFAKKDFYYSYIDDEKDQLEQSRKDKIYESNLKIIHISKLLKLGEVKEAYKQILNLREQNKFKVLRSSIEVLYASVLYKREAKKFSVKASQELSDAVNKSIINQSDLLDALKLLVEINIKINKLNDAKFYANNILNTFNDSLSLAYGQIAIAKINIKKRRYKRAITSLYKILLKTKNLEVATIVADELFDAYILNKQNDKAYALTSKVLDKNMDYYSNNSYMAQVKINKLLKSDMPHLAIKILKDLLRKATLQKHINTFKYKLATVYMSIYTREDIYMLKAKELYKDLIRQKNNNDYQSRSKMYLDEILMRQEILTTQIVVKKYANSAPMYNKSLLQELLTYKKYHEYEKINKLKNVYLKIGDVTTRRFGYENIEQVFDLINSDMIKGYLNESKCQLLDEVIVDMKKSALKKLIEDEKANEKLFSCMLEYPNKDSFDIANKIFSSSKDPKNFFTLEKIALKLNLNKEAYKLSQKIDSSGDSKLKSDEFLYKFIIYSNQNNSYSMDKFFSFASKNNEYIQNNKNDPRIIDFYYQYYLYLIKSFKEKKSIEILKKLYEKQNDMDAHVYSPFVEMQLAQNEKLDDNYIGSIEYLELALENTRKVSNNNLVQIYYNMAKSYEKLNKKNRYLDLIEKCKNVKNVDSLYKKMCDEL